MSKRKAQLRITLKSDLCAGSGYSYAGVVDTDACYDAAGLPYIPAKRLKGCLRDAAGMIGITESQTERIFGKAGEDRARGVFLGDACLENYEQLYRELSGMEKEMRGYVTPLNILEEFTRVKAQTRIMENGIADDNTLRFTRVVNHFSPVSEGKELQFVAEVFYEDMDENDIRLFKNSVLALRNIGLNRNRGLGSVRCKVEDIPESQNAGEAESIEKLKDVRNSHEQKPGPEQNFGAGEEKDAENSKDIRKGGEAEIPEDCDQSPLHVEDMEDEKTYVMAYTVRNTAPLVLSAENDYTTEKYISGQRVLGCLADAYLRSGGDGDSEEFAEMFLKNQVIFSSLYPCDRGKDSRGHIYYPAPAYINRLKKTKRFVNVSKTVPRTPQECEQAGIAEDFASGNGNQPKRLTGKFTFVEGNQVKIREVETEIAYHHRKKAHKNDTEEDEMLYAFEVVRRQQVFAGTITGKGKYLKKLGNYLEKGRLRFGKSRSSQYGTCVLDGSLNINEAEGRGKRIPKETRILAVLQSDAIFVNEFGYTVKCREVRDQIREVLGIRETEDETLYTEIAVKELTGYYSKWNLKRQAIPVVCAGSTFEFCLAEDLVLKDGNPYAEGSSGKGYLYAGERIGEGYGKIAVVMNGKEDCTMQEADAIIRNEEKLNAAKILCRRVLLKELKERLMQNVQNTQVEVNSAAALGRITQMLTDSCNAYPEDPYGRYSDFRKRIGSIKTAALRKTAENLCEEWISGSGDLKSGELNYVSLAEMKDPGALYERYFGKKDFVQELCKMWSDYFMAILVKQKYELKHREGKK